MNYWLSLFVLFSMLPVSANAYVCSRVTTPNGPDTGPSLSWFSRIIPISINEDGTSQLDADQEFQVVERLIGFGKDSNPILIPAPEQ